MMIDYSVASKKNFIRWFLINFNVKQKESSWILNQIMSNDALLERVHIIEEAKKYKNALLIPTRCDESLDVLTYYNANGSITKNSDKEIFRHLIDNPERNIYIELKFKNRHRHLEYLNILETVSQPKEEEETEFSSTAESLLRNLEYSFSLQYLVKKIDEALINRNKDEFNLLSSEYKKLLSIKPKEEYSIIKR